MADEKKRVVAPHDLSPDDFDIDTVSKVIRVRAKGGLPSKIVTQLSVDDDGRMRWKEDGIDKVADLSDLIQLPEGIIENLTFTDWGRVTWTMNSIQYTYDIFPQYTDDDRRKKLGIQGSDGELGWLPFALGTVVIGGTGLLNINPLNYHGMLVQLNASSTAVGFRINPGSMDGELLAIVNRDPDTPMAIELAAGLTLQAHRGAQRTATGGLILMPTGTVWVRATNSNVTVWGDLVLSTPKLPDMTTGGPYDRLAINDANELTWMPMNLPSLVYNTQATQVITPATAHGRLVHIDPGPTTALEIAGGSGADDWFFIVNRTGVDLSVKGVTGVGINAVEDAVGSQLTNFVLKRWGTIAVRTSLANAKIWGDLRLKTDMPVSPATPGSVLSVDLTGETTWSAPLAKAGTVLSLRYGTTATDDSTFGWNTVKPETTTGQGGLTGPCNIDPIGDNVGFVHYIAVDHASINLHDQPGAGACLTFATNASAVAKPVTKEAGVPTIVSAFGETPYVKPGGTIQILFDNRVPITRRVVIWGDLQAAP